jgi:hypothetical protein
MLAFHSDPKIKQKYLKRVSAHEKADEIVKGHYWENGTGCAVGCSIHGSSHAAYETELGIPQILARLEDGIFENIPNELAKTWPRRFLEAIKPGADLSAVWPKFVVWMMLDDEYGVIQFAKTDRTRESIEMVADMYQLKADGADISQEDWRNVRDTAYRARRTAAADAAADAYAAAAAAAYADAAADAAAYAAADAAAYADAAADAAAYAAADAAAYADAAADAAAYADAAADAKRTKWRIAQSEKLVQLLKEAK